MLPEVGTSLAGGLTLQEQTSRTFYLNREHERIAGMTDELDAMRQAIYLILSTERYKYIIYGWDYGVELLDLLGQPVDYVQSELKRRVIEALTWDSRITAVENFEFAIQGKRVACTFTARTIFGDIEADKAVDF